MKKYLLILSALMISLTGISQDLKIGVRTGVSYYKLLGELEANETQNYSSGFAFGITGQYNFSNSFGLRTELSYIQKSTEQVYTDNFLTVFRPDVTLLTFGTKTAVFGGGTYTLKKNFNIFAIPIHAVYKPFRKFEVFGGIDFDFIAGVAGQGNMSFVNDDLDPSISFIQTFNYNYSSDAPSEFRAPQAQNNLIVDYDLNEDGVVEKITIPKTLPAFYYYDYDAEASYKAFKSFDIAISAGASYYINPGLYIRGVVNYGLRDSNNTEFDYSLQEINEDASFIFRDDYDRKIGGQLSIGFQF